MWRASLPSVEMTLLLGPPLAALVAGSGYLAGRLKLRHGLRTGDTRKIFHFMVFSAAALLHVLWGIQAVNLLGAIVTVQIGALLVLGAGNVFYEGLAREGDEPHRSLHILVPFAATALGGMASTALFGAHAAMGFLVTGWADAIAEPIGSRFGVHRYRVPSIARIRCERSLEGSFSVLAASFASAAILLAMTPLGADLPAGRLLATAVAVALAATVVEAISPHGLDNLTVQLAASWVSFAAR